MSNIKMYPLKETIYTWLKQLGFTDYTAIQAEVIPPALKGKDIVGVSATGTGKTHSFLIPVFQHVDSSDNRVQAVITAPTRELAHQIYVRAQEYQQYDKDLVIRLITGEVEKSRMSEQLRNQQPHIVIGTPGRLKDMFLKEEVLRLDTTDMLVVDEADMTLEFGFLDEVDEIAGRMKDDLQMLVFSATIPLNLQPFLKKYMNSPKIIRIHENVAKAKVRHILVPCKHMTYQEKLLKILPGFNPYLCLIFANTRKDASETANFLRENGYTVTEMHGDLSTRQRKNAMKNIAQQDAEYIVATDIAARGMDIEGVSHVVSLGFPHALEYYIHRAGRTGRMNLDGICYALYNEKDDTAIRNLMGKGITFEHQDYKREAWTELKPYGERRPKKNDLVEKEIAKMLTKKKTKVKPGYKKKRREEIEKIKRKQRREMIQGNIKAQQKERAKEKQRQKRAENENW